MRSRNKSRLDFNLDNIREVVDALIAGVPLSRVPESLHPKLLMPLSAAKNEATVAGQTAVIKRISAIMPKLRLNPQKDTSNSSANQSSSPSRDARTPKLDGRGGSYSYRSNNVDNNDDPESTLNEVIEGRPSQTINDSQVPQLIPLIKQRMKQTVEEGDFKTSQKLENLLQEMNSRKLEATYNTMKDQQLSSLNYQLMQAKEALRSAKEYFKKTTEEYDQIYTENKETLEETHANQLKEYDSSFPKILPVNFWKVSPQVLQLREQEKHLVATHRFEEAIPFHERADKMELDELDDQRKKFLQAFHAQRQQLLNVQENQKECFEKNWKRKWETMEMEKQKEISARQQLVTNIQRRIQKIEGSPLNPEESPPATNRSRTPTARSMPLKKNMVRSPANVNPRVRSVAASRLTRRQPVVRKVGMYTP
ncbi:hypothetical protein TRFO_12519 [Tritrichomonas foetus]|uniref:Uncharacterized protein n=1 Tax=Tritrichomonas foetus TaxID=1144522 RepID=A0A1J4L2M7_9EUKA|nr:hypothetical protein TRFO_12519 [Tritrichomonas foetus]|eukprot:OHT17344.1 hypothetical protein TRFO_12519 [Tritrichomonas foetus]